MRQCIHRSIGAVSHGFSEMKGNCFAITPANAEVSIFNGKKSLCKTICYFGFTIISIPEDACMRSHERLCISNVILTSAGMTA